MAIPLISGHFNSHHDGLILTKRGRRAFSGVREMTCELECGGGSQLCQLIKTNLFEDF